MKLWIGRKRDEFESTTIRLIKVKEKPRNGAFLVTLNANNSNELLFLIEWAVQPLQLRKRSKNRRFQQSFVLCLCH
ncbi:hypothetical protein [Acinetobacter phage Ab69]|nr:hypothetical protein [Acinetobacter phage Ab69]